MKKTIFSRSITICVLVAAALTLASCSREVSSKTGEVETVKLQQEWFPFAGFAGEVAASKRFASANGLKLDIVPGAEDVDPIKLVISKSYDFGVVGSDLLVAAVAKGAPLIAIGAVNYKSPTCFIVKADSKISAPADFIGKRVGILSGTNTERVYQLMMKRAGVDRAKVRETQVPFELQTFILGQYDVRPAFVYDEPVTLEENKVAYRIIDPAQYGVHFLGTVYFTRLDVLQNKRPTAERLIRTLAQGWNFANSEPEKAIDDLVAAYPSLKRSRELRSLELAKPFFTGENGKPLTASTQSWQDMIDGLQEINVIPANSVTVSKVWTAELVQKAQ